jgi:hypothetical protein
MVLVTIRHSAGNWMRAFYSPPPEGYPDSRVVAALQLEGGRAQVTLGDGTDATVIAACLELEAALATIRQQAQAHALTGVAVTTDVPLAESEMRAAWGDR